MITGRIWVRIKDDWCYYLVELTNIIDNDKKYQEILLKSISNYVLFNQDLSLVISETLAHIFEQFSPQILLLSAFLIQISLRLEITSTITFFISKKEQIC